MIHSFISLFVSATVLWVAPDADAIRAELAPFLQEGEVLPAHTTSGTTRYEEVIGILRRSSEPLQNYLDQCDRLAWQELPFAQPIALPKIPLNIHVSEGRTNYLWGALRFYLAQRLVQARLFDEAKKVLDDLLPENCLDPVEALILKAVVFHHFSAKEEGLAALKEFRAVAAQEPVSRRAAELAKLLQFDWERQSKEEETQKIANQMNNVRRRLGQGRTDDDTQDAEKDVLQSLDKLIEQLEQQRQRQRQQGNAGQQSNNPAEESGRFSQKGPGNVDRREFSPGDNWGDLPPKDREKALLKIEKEFPAHYRDIIEQYFREMAK
ncbi:MAG: hypothetical protein LBI05_12125 [Planctomycetaceae bacterium]|jgi:hypothetical protein|nr:hypothetical protein [Planctomycetaceae bacterium]